MATRDELAAQIRFQLDQLSARNGHHDFEHLCRHLARMRICSNILPATGPVSAGGDQGRDFETFRTYLSESPIAGSSFVGLASQEPLVFACTLTQKDNLKAKIKADVTVIKGSGAPVAEIHYFCSADLPISQRHDLQKWSSEDHGVQLEVYDGQAISELLIEPDVFWIASRYLSIPAEIYPASPGGESWYLELLTKWKRSDLEPQNFADFGELKSAARHATFTAENAKPDLPFWIEKLTALQKTTTWPRLQRRSTYEIAVASLRGLGTLEGYEDQLRSFFSEVPELYETADLEDAAVLWTYSAGAYRRGLVHLESHDLTSWRDTIVEKVDEELTRTTLPGRRSSLLEIRGYLASVMSAGTPESKLDYASAMRYWLELTDIVSQAPLFPLERFSDRLTKRLEMGAPPDLDKLTVRIDELLAERLGQAAAAAKCRDRAFALYKRGEVIRAIKQIHQAKVKWFSDETLHGSILAMLFLSRCYLDLGLVFAAKYHALMAAYASVRSSQEALSKLASSALNVAASCDYLQGAWCGFLDLEFMVLVTFSAFSREDDPADPNSEINIALFHVSVIHRLTRLLNPEFLPLLEERVNRWGLEDMNDFLESVEDPWHNKEIPEVWTSLEKQMLGRPFSDLGLQREASFNALGVTWKVSWDNTYEMTAASEQFLAALQIILADLAGIDLCLLRTIVEVEISLGQGQKIFTSEVPSNDLTKLRVALPSSYQSQATSSEIMGWVMAAASTLLHSASVLPSQQLLALMEGAFREGLSTKIFSVERYEILYREFTAREDFDSYNRRSLETPELRRHFNPSHNQQLEWFSEPGPGYSKEAAEEGIGNRYKNSIIPIAKSLRRLSSDPDFQKIVRALKEESWLDWHILVALMNLILNYKLQKVQRSGVSMNELTHHFNQWAHEPEAQDGTLVPLEEISVQNLRFHLRSSMLVTLRSYGLEIPHRTPDFQAISDFLGVRYRYWIDDIDHPDYGFGNK